jgi:DNA-binding Lrp family transcriptional regulator
MDVENNFIKPILSFHFSKGHSEAEAYAEISKEYGPYGITLRTIYKWYKLFRSTDYYYTDSDSPLSNNRLINELKITNINKRCNKNEIRLNRIKDTAIQTANTRITNPQSVEEDTYIQYRKKQSKKRVNLTDEYIINLVNSNPTLNMEELAKLANSTASTICYRIKKINSSSSGEIIKYVSKRTKDGKLDQNGKPIAKYNTRIKDEFIIDLINQNPDLNMKELSKMASVSEGTIANRIKKINNLGETEIYISKKYRRGKTEIKKKSPKLKFSDEFLIDLVNKNPDFNMKELAEIAGASQATISKRIKQINSEGEKIRYRKKDSLKGITKFSDEHLISLINENPDLNMTELASMLDSSQAAISLRLKRIDEKGDGTNYIRKRAQKREKYKDDLFLFSNFNNGPEYDSE